MPFQDFLVQPLLLLPELLVFQMRGKANATSGEGGNRSGEDKHASNHASTNDCTSGCQTRGDTRSGKTDHAQSIQSSERTDTTNTRTQCSSQDFGDGTLFNCTERIVDSFSRLIYNIDDLLERVNALESHFLLLFYIAAHRNPSELSGSIRMSIS